MGINNFHNKNKKKRCYYFQEMCMLNNDLNSANAISRRVRHKYEPR